MASALLVILLTGTAALRAPAPVRTSSTRLYSTTEPSSRRGQVPPADREASADWLARQGLVAPGASPEMHEKAKAARLKRKGGGALVVREKRARWGDAARVRDVPIDGGWSGNVARGTSTSSAAIVGGERARHLSQIVVATRDVARELRLAAAAAACDFGALAKSMSLEPVSGGEEGRIGWVEHGAGEQLATDGMLPAEARAAVMAEPLKPGDVTVVGSGLGFHVVKVDDAMHDLDLATKPRKKVRGAATDLAGACAGKTYAMVTMGCQMNAADSERLEGSLRQLGLVEAPDPKLANVVVLNTCSIREHAETKVYSYVGPQAKRKRNGEDVTIVVAGCVAQQEGARLLRRAPEVDVVMGPQYANRLPDVLERAMVHGEQVAATSASYGATSTSTAASGAALDAPTAPRRASGVVAWVTITHGCNERCTYCVVPNTRGVEQSRAPDEILAEIDELGNRGYREVTLLGQNVDAYGRDMRPRRHFHDLLAAVAAVARRHGDMRVRFVTSHPRYITDAVIDAVADHGDVIMPVFHMPAQSGDDAMLRLMGRGYTADRYRSIVAKIRKRLPDATISSDFIVGCPGESEAAFDATLALMDDVEFDACMTAAYSPRPGTPMAHWDGAADAFATLGVDVSKLADRETAVDDAKARVRGDFRALAEARLGALRNGDDDEDAWDATVKAKADALAALDRAAAAPRSAFHPLTAVGPRQCDDDVKEDRLRRINAKSDAHVKRRAERYLGRVEPVLVEQRNTRAPTQVVGRTRGNKLVFFEGDADDLVGRTVDVEITEANTFSLVGVRVDGDAEFLE